MNGNSTAMIPLQPEKALPVIDVILIGNLNTVNAFDWANARVPIVEIVSFKSITPGVFIVTKLKHL